MNELEEVFAQQSTPMIARQLLGMYLEHETPQGRLGGYIVDCEAYLGPDDLAAHSYGMRHTPRVAAMYEKPGTIYLYQMHTHLILNFITQPEGMPQGIMIRGLEPVDGIAKMEANRKKSGPDLSNGPGKLVKALGITQEYYGQSIFTSRLHLVNERRRTPKEILAIPRIGIPNKGEWTDKPLRFVVAGNPYITNSRKAAVQPDHGWL
jgi:DNA-3-methyladenine glycosylase